MARNYCHSRRSRPRWSATTCSTSTRRKPTQAQDERICRSPTNRRVRPLLTELKKALRGHGADTVDAAMGTSIVV